MVTLAACFCQRSRSGLCEVAALDVQAADRSNRPRTSFFMELTAEIGADSYMLVAIVHDQDRNDARIVSSNWIFDAIELTGKRLQILKEAFPKTVRIAVINSIQPVSDLQFSAVQSEAKKLGMDILRIELRRREDFEQQYEQVRKGRADALYPLDNAINNQLRNLLVDFASQYQLPVIYGSKQYVDAGGLMSYGADLLANYRRGAAFVDKILNGAKPADLPVERPTKFELVINMKTAKALGMKISNSILVQATNVIE